MTEQFMALGGERLGPLLRRRRHELQLTQQDVAILLGMLEETVCRWETGGRRPRLKTLRTLATQLQIPYINIHDAYINSTQARFFPVAQCGTQSGAVVHRRCGEDLCPECREAERLASRSYRKYSTKPKPQCGKLSGYWAHHNRGEKACASCREAYREYDRERQRKKGRRGEPFKPAKHGTRGGVMRHRRERAGEWGVPLCEPCLAADAEYTMKRSRSKARVR